MADKGAQLKAACDAVLAAKDLQPEYKNGTLMKTHCNRGARRIAQAMGCLEFDDLGATADIMYAIMASNGSKRWRKVAGADATIHALGGGLTFAALPSDKLHAQHGHIAAVYPVGMQASGSFHRDVPMVANVGKGDENRRNFICKSSAAFPVGCGEAHYFIWS